VKAIYERELKAYFQGLTGYLFIAFILLFAGIYVMAINLTSGYPYFEYVLGNMCFIFIVVIPILTMRVISEERRQRTDQLLYALPIPMYQIVLGKYLAMLTVLAIPCVLVGIYPLILTAFGTVNLLTAYGSLLAFFLLGAGLMAIGMFISSMTENQVISAALCFLVMLLNYFMSTLANYLSSSVSSSFIALTICAILVGFFFKLMTKNNYAALLAGALCEIPLLGILIFSKDTLSGLFPNVIENLSLFERFYTFINGTFDLNNILYLLTVIAVFVYFTVQSLERRRWN
jgi:ABC-2 type transport system permease protein